MQKIKQIFISIFFLITSCLGLTSCTKTMEDFALDGGAVTPSVADSTTTTTVSNNHRSLGYSPGATITQGTTTGMRARLSTNDNKLTGTDTKADVSINKQQTQ